MDYYQEQVVEYLRSDRAILVRRGSGMTPSGQPLPSLTAEWGENLLHWDIAPYVGQPHIWPRDSASPSCSPR